MGNCCVKRYSCPGSQRRSYSRGKVPDRARLTDTDGNLLGGLNQPHAHFGRLDIVLNNAGYSLVGTIEEASEANVRALFETNYFGTMRVIQTALPLLRQQGGGHILGVSSSLGLMAMPLIGYYCTSKWAVAHAATHAGPFKLTVIRP